MPIIQRLTPHYAQPQQAVRLSGDDGFYYASLAGNKYLEAGILPGISSTKIVNQRGIAGELVLASGQISGPITAIPTGSWSILIDFKPTYKFNVFPYFMGISGAANPFALAWAHDTLGGRAGWYDGTTLHDSGLTFPIGEQHTLGVTYNDATRVYSFFKDGVAGTTPTGASTGLGNWQFAAPGGEANTTHISLAAFSNKALSAARMRELTANPWQIYTPRKRQIYVAASSASARTSTTSLTAAIRQARVATSSASAAILAARSAAASLSSAVQVNRAATTGIDSALLRAVTVQAGLSAALRQLRTVTTGADAAIKRALTASASLDSAIKAARTASAGMDGYVLGGNMAVASLTAAIKSSRSALASVDAAIQTARATSAGLSAGVLDRKTAIAALNAYVFAGRLAVASLNAAIIERKTYTTALNAYVLAGALLTVPRQMHSNSQASRRSNTQTARRP